MSGSPAGETDPSARLVLAGCVLGAAETLLPRPLPFVKPGLANAAGLLAAISGGTGRALRVNMMRSVALAAATGSLATPAFPLSLSCSAASAAVMGPAARAASPFSPTAVCILGSAAGMTAQVLTARLLLPGLPLEPVLLAALIWATAAGAAVAVFTGALLGSGLAARLGIGLVPPGGGGIDSTLIGGG